jgi:hypothetical protein
VPVARPRTTASSYKVDSCCCVDLCFLSFLVHFCLRRCFARAVAVIILISLAVVLLLVVVVCKRFVPVFFETV